MIVYNVYNRTVCIEITYMEDDFRTHVYKIIWLLPFFEFTKPTVQFI